MPVDLVLKDGTGSVRLLCTSCYGDSVEKVTEGLARTAYEERAAYQ